MTEYIREHGLLPSREIDRLIVLTPTEPLTQGDFERLRYSNWAEWLAAICNPVSGINPQQLLLRIVA